MPKMWRNSLYTDRIWRLFLSMSNCDEDFYDFEVTDTEGLEDTHNVFVPVECMAAEYPIEDQCYIIPIQEFRALENVKLITE